MPDLVAVSCTGCAVTLLRHPAMRNKKAICFECQRQLKNERREKARQTQRIEQAIAVLKKDREKAT
jgi:hypothetical protein